MRNKVFILCGILGPIVYIATVILGGILRPGYSHISQAVSELIATGAPNKILLDPLFAIYNLLTTAFGIGLFLRLSAEDQNCGKVVGALGALFLTVVGITGFMIVFFPADPGEFPPATLTGAMHIVLAGLASLGSMLTILLIGFWFRSIPYLRGYGAYSFISAMVVFLSGGLAAAAAANNSPVMGLLERITIGGFLQWLFGTALRMYASEIRMPKEE